VIEDISPTADSRLSAYPRLRGRAIAPSRAFVRWWRDGNVLSRWWRFYAAIAVVLIGTQVYTLFGPPAEPLFAPHRGVDVGAFYTVALMVRDGRRHELGNVDAQAEVQQALQEREQTVWRWFEPMPHPPAVALAALPLTLLPLRTAYWVWTVAAFLAAAVAAWCVARRCAPRAAIATTVILLSFRPLWGLLWWGEDDTFVLLPFLIGVVLLLTPSPADPVRARRRDVGAGLLMGAIALRPQFALVPLLALALGRRRAALGMAASGGALALISVATVGLHGSQEYLDLWRRYDAVQVWHPGVRPDLMFSIRGAIVRLHRPMRAVVQQSLTWGLSLALGAVAVLVGGRGLRRNRAPDLALSVVVLGMLLSSPHSHQQSMVFLYLPLAVGIGRSLAATTPFSRLAWAAAMLALHGSAALLGNELTRQTVLTAIGFVLLTGFALACANQAEPAAVPAT
jgi:Glycosyltransferase family 87